MGSRTTITAAQLRSIPTTRPSVQHHLHPFRRRLLGWRHGLGSTRDTLTSSPPFPVPREHIPAPNSGEGNQPAWPWYQYPFDCLRMCWLTQTALLASVFHHYSCNRGFPSLQGHQSNMWSPWINSLVSFPQPYPQEAQAAIGTLSLFLKLPKEPSVGAPVFLRFLRSARWCCCSVSVVNVLRGRHHNRWELLRDPTNPIPQFSTSGLHRCDIHAHQQSAPTDQRVILTNQEFAIGNYVKTSPMKTSSMMTSKSPFFDCRSRLCIALSETSPYQCQNRRSQRYDRGGPRTDATRPEGKRRHPRLAPIRGIDLSKTTLTLQHRLQTGSHLPGLLRDDNEGQQNLL